AVRRGGETAPRANEATSNQLGENMRKILGTFCTALALVAVPVATQAEVGVTDDEIKIGEVLMLSGPASFIGKSAAAGSKLAIAAVNANGGIHGRMLRGIYEDDGYVPSRSVAAARRLIEVEEVFALTGTTG